VAGLGIGEARGKVDVREGGSSVSMVVELGWTVAWAGVTDSPEVGSGVAVY